MKRQRNQRGSRQRTVGQQGAGEIVQSGRVLFTGTTTAGVSTVITSLTMLAQSNTLAALSNTFALYRFEKLKIRSQPYGTGSTPSGLGYVQGTITTPPTSLVNLEFYPCSRLVGGTATVPQTLNVSGLNLVTDNVMKFWRVTTTGADAFDATQFSIFLLNAGAVTYYLEILYTVRFCAQGSSASVPRPMPPALRDIEELDRCTQKPEQSTVALRQASSSIPLIVSHPTCGCQSCH